MVEPFLGEIRMFAGNFAPQGFAFAEGQLVLISQNSDLFSLYGTTYGGDGVTTFGLPDLRGRLPVHRGTGPGLSARLVGSKGGSETAQLTANQLPVHTHALQATESPGISQEPVGRALAPTGGLVDAYQEANDDPKTMAVESVSTAGEGQSHDNLQPFCCIHFIVALFGTVPT